MICARQAAFVATMTIGAAACMTGAQTMEQALAYQRFQRCSEWPTITLQRIDTDGRVIVTGSEAEKGPFLACMGEQVLLQQKSKAGLVVPEPVVNPRAR